MSAESLLLIPERNRGGGGQGPGQGFSLFPHMYIPVTMAWFQGPNSSPTHGPIQYVSHERQWKHTETFGIFNAIHIPRRRSIITKICSLVTRWSASDNMHVVGGLALITDE
jgi:hypothetical protein